MLKEIVQTQRSPAALQGSFKTQRNHSIFICQAERSPLWRKRISISKVRVMRVDNVIIIVVNSTVGTKQLTS